MASEAGVDGVRATLDLGSKNFKCVQCREPDSARITRDSEVIHLDEKRPTLSCDLRRVVCSQSAVCRQPVKLDYVQVADHSDGTLIRRLPNQMRSQTSVLTPCGAVSGQVIAIDSRRLAVSPEMCAWRPRLTSARLSRFHKPSWARE